MDEGRWLKTEMNYKPLEPKERARKSKEMLDREF
jgi:hypothetical protein